VRNRLNPFLDLSKFFKDWILNYFFNLDDRIADIVSLRLQVPVRMGAFKGCVTILEHSLIMVFITNLMVDLFSDMNILLRSIMLNYLFIIANERCIHRRLLFLLFYFLNYQ
jgi:hypothetical protein